MMNILHFQFLKMMIFLIFTKHFIMVSKKFSQKLFVCKKFRSGQFEKNTIRHIP